MDGLRLLVSHLHAQTASVGSDGHALVPQLASKVEGLAHRLLQCEPAGVLLHRRLDRGPHLRCGPEEFVGGHQALNPLVRTAKIVPIDEETEPSLAVGEVDEDSPREELVPQGLPEALHLPERLRVVRSTLDVLDALTFQLGLELRLPPPRRVLATVVRQHLARHAKGSQPALESFHHQLGLLSVRHRVADDEAAAVVHEDGHIEPLVTAQQESEDVRLPKLVRLRPLEAPRQRLGLLDFRRA